MSSPKKNFDSLSGLATAAKAVQMLLLRDVLDADQYDQLRDLINSLQAACPNHCGVVAARVHWFEAGLASFEQCVVIPAENGEDISEYDLTYGQSKTGATVTTTGALTGTEIINAFLRRSYLKDAFPRLYRRTMSLYSRLASVERLPKSTRAFFKSHVSRLEEFLIDGRL